MSLLSPKANCVQVHFFSNHCIFKWDFCDAFTVYGLWYAWRDCWKLVIHNRPACCVCVIALMYLFISLACNYAAECSIARLLSSRVFMCYDAGPALLDKYKYYVVINNGMRGPFAHVRQGHEQQHWIWTPFMQKLDSHVCACLCKSLSSSCIVLCCCASNHQYA